MQLELDLCEVLPVGEVCEWFGSVDELMAVERREAREAAEGWEACEAPAVERPDAREWRVTYRLGDQVQAFRIQAPSSVLARMRANSMVIDDGGFWQFEGVERLQ